MQNSSKLHKDCFSFILFLFQVRNGGAWRLKTDAHMWRRQNGCAWSTCRNTPTTSTAPDAENTTSVAGLLHQVSLPQAPGQALMATVGLPVQLERVGAAARTLPSANTNSTNPTNYTNNKNCSLKPINWLTSLTNIHTISVAIPLISNSTKPTNNCTPKIIVLMWFMDHLTHPLCTHQRLPLQAVQNQIHWGWGLAIEWVTHRHHCYNSLTHQHFSKKISNNQTQQNPKFNSSRQHLSHTHRVRVPQLPVWLKTSMLQLYQRQKCLQWIKTRTIFNSAEVPIQITMIKDQ